MESNTRKIIQYEGKIGRIDVKQSAFIYTMLYNREIWGVEQEVRQVL